MAVYSDILTRPSVGDRYTVKTLLGEGAFGEVFLADQHIAGVPGTFFRQVALKLFTQEYVSRENASKVFAEALLLEELAGESRALGDPVHLVSIYDIGILRDYHSVPYVAMECVYGSLEHELKKTNVPLPVAAVIRHTRGICAGLRLAHAHAPAIIHRDLKPANVLIARNGFLKVADFGLAIDRRRAFLETGQAGTISYSPPENRTGRQASPAFDVYSLGVMMLEMLIRRNPIAEELDGAGDNEAAMDKALAKAHGMLADLRDPGNGQPFANSMVELNSSKSMQKLLRGCLKLNPEERIANVSALDEALAKVEIGEEDDPPPPPKIETGRERINRLFAEAAPLVSNGDIGRAEALLEELRMDSSTEERYFALVSKLRKRQGRYEEAIVAQKEVNRINKDHNRGVVDARLIEDLACLYDSAGKSSAARILRKKAD